MFAGDVLKGRVALITGGGGGIGLEIARKYGQLGAKVVITGRSQDRLDSAVAQLRAEATDVLALQGDVRDYATVESWMAGAVGHFGALDILVNNAAGNFFCPTAELSPN
ncbi:MAG: SDR family NAD(P)-dependent oxidoreductase, partial [Burkholderiaceae bacterium]|nr:SDR family NAD(P)-dependent oxidoreductase [Burkholderiaceae bacterium]